MRYLANSSYGLARRSSYLLTGNSAIAALFGIQNYFDTSSSDRYYMGYS